MATQSISRITEEEYLRLERAAERKSEFIGGEIFPMPGGTLRHARLVLRMIKTIESAIGRQGCEVFSSDARIRTPVTGSFVYPDVVVVSGKPETYKSNGDNLLNPTVIVEVLSPSTADYDHGKKFELYREIPSFADYLLVHTPEPRIEHFVKHPDGGWYWREHRGTESLITISSIECTFSLAEAYGKVLEIPD